MPEVEPATSDGAKHRISAIHRYALNRLIAYDKFHLRQKLNWAPDSPRKEELRKGRMDENNELVELVNRRK